MVELMKVSLSDGVDCAYHDGKIALCFNYRENERTVEIDRNRVERCLIIADIGACAFFCSAFGYSQTGGNCNSSAIYFLYFICIIIDEYRLFLPD